MPRDPLLGLFDLLQPGLPMYLADCGLWSYPGPEEIRLALADLVADQRNVLDRAAVVVAERGQARPRVVYPISFSGGHDVDLRHMLPRLIAGLDRQRSELETLAATPDDDAAAGFATEALRSLQQHRDILAGLKGPIAAPLSGT
jgi:hypothetical protein